MRDANDGTSADRCGSSYGPHPAIRQCARLLVALVALAACQFGWATMAPAIAAEGQPVKLVAFGDSLTAGYGLPEAAAFPAVLSRALKAKGYDVEITNAGVSGDTASGGLERLDWSVPDGTEGVILELGANDMLRGTDPAVTKKALDTIITRLRARGIKVMLAGMFASRNLGPDYVARFDAIYPDLARTYGLKLYPFFLDGVVGEEKLHLPDGLHPTAEGVSLMVERILPTVESFIQEVKG